MDEKAKRKNDAFIHMKPASFLVSWVLLGFVFAFMQLTLLVRGNEDNICIINIYQKIPLEAANTIAVNPEGTLIAISTPSEGVLIYDVETLELSTNLSTNEDSNFGGTALAWQADNSHLIAFINSEIGFVVWDLETKEIDYTIPIPNLDATQAIESLEWSASGRYIAFTGSFLPLWIWDTVQEEFALILEHKEPHYNYNRLTEMISWYSNDDILAFVDGTELKLWNSEGGEITTIDPENLTELIGVSWSMSGNLAINGGIGQPIAVYASNKLDHSIAIINQPFTPYHHEVLSFEWSPEETFIATAGDSAIEDNELGGDVVIRNVLTENTPVILTGHLNRVFDIEWSPFENYIFSISFDWDVFRWDIENECPNAFAQSANNS